MLNEKQERAAYLLSTGESIQRISEALEIAPELLNRWVQLPHFASAINVHRQAFMDEQQKKLDFLIGKAIQTLEEVFSAGSTPEKLRAAEIVLNNVELNRPIQQQSFHHLVENLTQSPDSPVSAQASPAAPLNIELTKIDETILEECLEDLHAYLDGKMTIEKAKARLYPVINPNNLTLISASALLPEIQAQVEANQTKHFFVPKA